MASRRSKDLLVFGIAAAALTADQLSKLWVRGHLTFGVPWDPIPWLRPILSFTYITNTGAAFGMFPWLSAVYPAITLVVVALIAWFSLHSPHKNTLVAICLGLVMGGALGNNVVDRLVRGRVTDFLDLNFWPLREWPVFNVADSCVVVGVCVLSIYLLLTGELSDERADSSAGGPAIS